MPTIFLLIFLWMPESPYHLLAKGKREDAVKTLRWLRGGVPEDNIEKELIEIQVMYSSFALLHAYVLSQDYDKRYMSACSTHVVQIYQILKVIFTFWLDVAHALKSQMSSILFHCDCCCQTLLTYPVNCRKFCYITFLPDQKRYLVHNKIIYLFI